MGTSANTLPFQTCNVVFSLVVGLVLLLLGAYGRFSGNLPVTSPYARPHPWADEPPEVATTPEEVAADAAMREAEIAVVEHRRPLTRADGFRQWPRCAHAATGDGSG